MRKSKKEKNIVDTSMTWVKTIQLFAIFEFGNTYLDTSLERGTIVYDVGFLENSQQFKEITGALVEHLQATFLKMKNSYRE